MKIYAWDGFRAEAERKPNGSHQTHEIVAAKNGAEFMRITGKSRHFLNTWVSETGNEEDVRVATAEPGVIFWTELDFSGKTGNWRRDPPSTPSSQLPGGQNE